MGTDCLVNSVPLEEGRHGIPCILIVGIVQEDGKDILDVFSLRCAKREGVKASALVRIDRVWLAMVASRTTLRCQNLASFLGNVLRPWTSLFRMLPMMRACVRSNRKPLDSSATKLSSTLGSDISTVAEQRPWQHSTNASTSISRLLNSLPDEGVPIALIEAETDFMTSEKEPKMASAGTVPSLPPSSPAERTSSLDAMGRPMSSFLSCQSLLMCFLSKLGVLVVVL